MIKNSSILNFIGNAIPGWNTNSANIKFTPEGGLAVKLINNTGSLTTKGYIVQPSSSLDNAIQYTVDDDIDPIGIIYDNNIANGDPVWIVIAGLAYVYYGTTVTRGTFSRVPVVADGLSSGQAINEALPTSPFATDKHFQEIGHPLESIGSPGLALTVLHFN